MELCTHSFNVRKHDYVILLKEITNLYPVCKYSFKILFEFRMQLCYHLEHWTIYSISQTQDCARAGLAASKARTRDKGKGFVHESSYARRVYRANLGSGMTSNQTIFIFSDIVDQYCNIHLWMEGRRFVLVRYENSIIFRTYAIDIHHTDRGDSNSNMMGVYPLEIVNLPKKCTVTPYILSFNGWFEKSFSLLCW